MKKTVEVVLGGEPRPCRLGIGELRQLEAKCNAGAATILARLVGFQPQVAATGRPRPQDFSLGEADPDYQARLNIYSVLSSIGGDWRIDDIRETIRLGLEGGGMPPTDAWLLVATHIDARAGGYVAFIDPAAEILEHALSNDPADPAGKAESGTTRPQATDA